MNLANIKASAFDYLYRALWIFTYLYLSALTLIFLSHLEKTFWFESVDVLSEPYLAAVAVYVVLKEIRKSRLGIRRGRRRGELFIVWWLGLLTVSSLLVVSPAYNFNDAFRLILTNAVTTTLIYLGSIINRP